MTARPSPRPTAMARSRASWPPAPPSTACGSSAARCRSAARRPARCSTAVAPMAPTAGVWRDTTDLPVRLRQRPRGATTKACTLLAAASLWPSMRRRARGHVGVLRLVSPRARPRDPMHPPCDLIAVPSAFTHTTGQTHWELLLRARAIENQCYVLAPAQGGLHENGRQPGTACWAFGAGWSIALRKARAW